MSERVQFLGSPATTFAFCAAVRPWMSDWRLGFAEEEEREEEEEEEEEEEPEAL